LLASEPGLDRGLLVAAVAAEFEVRDPVFSGCFAYPGFGYVENVTAPTENVRFRMPPQLVDSPSRG